MKQIKSILGAELTKEGIPRPCCWGSLEAPRQPPLPTSARPSTPLLWLLPPQHGSGWTGWSLRRALACPPAPRRARIGSTRSLLSLLIPSPSISVESPLQVRGSRASSPGADLLWVSLRGHVSARYHVAGSWVGHVLQLQRVPGPWAPGCPALGGRYVHTPSSDDSPRPPVGAGRWAVASRKNFHKSNGTQQDGQKLQEEPLWPHLGTGDQLRMGPNGSPGGCRGSAVEPLKEMRARGL